jgi:hypothetical protein
LDVSSGRLKHVASLNPASISESGIFDCGISECSSITECSISCSFFGQKLNVIGVGLAVYSFGVFVGDMHREELWVPWRSFRILILCQILCIVAVVEVTMHIKEEEDLHIKGGLHFLAFSRNLTSQLGMNND